MDDLANIHGLSHLGLDPGHPLSVDGVVLGQLNPLHAELDLSGNMMDFYLAAADTPTVATVPASVDQTPPTGPTTAGTATSFTVPVLNVDPLSLSTADGSVSFVSAAEPVPEEAEVEAEERAIPVDELVQKPAPEAEPPAEMTETVVRGQAVQLEDGSTALVEEVPKAGLHTVHLNDGTMAYITVSAYAQLFSGPEYTGPPLSMVTQPAVSENAPKKPTTTINIIPNANTPVRSNPKNFRCTIDGCTKAYNTACHLRVHLRTHSDEKPFVCQYAGCGKQFNTSYALKAHNRIHTGEKPYICPNEDCRKGFKTSGDLGKHIRTHTGERPFKCPFEGCDRSFTTSNIRKVHIRVHTGEKPFRCDLADCDKTFSSQTNYKNHMRMHRGEKPYICTISGCEKRFTEYSSLYKHHATHSKVKSYLHCGFCGKAYRQSSTLGMHIQTAHAMFAANKNRVIVTTASPDTAITNIASKQQRNSKKSSPDNFTLRINEPSETSSTTLDMKMAVIDDATLRNLIGKITSEQIDKTRMGVTVGEGSQIAPIALQLNGDHSLGQLYLVTDPDQLRILKELLSKDQADAGQSASDCHVMSSTLIGPCMKEEKPVIGSDSVTSLDSESNDLIGQLIGNGDGCSLSSSEIFSLVSTS